MTGMYELPDKYIQVDLDITSRELETIKSKLQKDKRIFFWKGWIKILNHDKYNSYKGEKIETAKLKELDKIPNEVKNFRYLMDTSIATSIDTPNNQKPKDIIINQKPKTSDEIKKEIRGKIKTF